MLLLLCGCGFRLRNAQQWPSQLAVLHFSAPDAAFNAQSSLKLFLKSMHVRLYNAAPFTFKITNYVYNESQPTSSNSSIPTTITFSLSMDVSILNKDGTTCIAPFEVSSAVSQLEPSATTIVRASDPDIQMRLLDNITQSIFTRITSSNLLTQLDTAQCQIHQYKGK